MGLGFDMGCVCVGWGVCDWCPSFLLPLTLIPTTLPTPPGLPHHLPPLPMARSHSHCQYHPLFLTYSHPHSHSHHSHSPLPPQDYLTTSHLSPWLTALDALRHLPDITPEAVQAAWRHVDGSLPTAHGAVRALREAEAGLRGARAALADAQTQAEGKGRGVVDSHVDAWKRVQLALRRATEGGVDSAALRAAVAAGVRAGAEATAGAGAEGAAAVGQAVGELEKQLADEGMGAAAGLPWQARNTIAAFATSALSAAATVADCAPAIASASASPLWPRMAAAAAAARVPPPSPPPDPRAVAEALASAVAAPAAPHAETLVASLAAPLLSLLSQTESLPASRALLPPTATACADLWHRLFPPDPLACSPAFVIPFLSALAPLASASAAVGMAQVAGAMLGQPDTPLRPEWPAMGPMHGTSPGYDQARVALEGLVGPWAPSGPATPSPPRSSSAMAGGAGYAPWGVNDARRDPWMSGVGAWGAASHEGGAALEAESSVETSGVWGEGGGDARGVR